MKTFESFFIFLAGLCVVLFLTFPLYYIPIMSYKTPYQALDGQVLEGKTLLVSEDGGGHALARMAHLKQTNRRDISVRLDGICMSACLYYLQSNNVCTTPRTVFLIHHLYVDNPNYMTSLTQFITNFITNHGYKDGLKDWIYHVEGELDKGEDYYFMGEDLINTGWIKACEDDTPHTDDYMNKIRNFVDKKNESYLSILTAPEFKGL